MPDKVKEFYGAIESYGLFKDESEFRSCLLYTSDAADE